MGTVGRRPWEDYGPDCSGAEAANGHHHRLAAPEPPGRAVRVETTGMPVGGARWISLCSPFSATASSGDRRQRSSGGAT